MKRLLLLLICLFSLMYDVNAQSKDTIVFSRNKFVLSGIEMNYNQTMEVMKDVPEALHWLKKAKMNNTFASIFGFAAGFSIGYPLGQAISGGDPEWGLLAVGGGATLIALPFIINSKKHSIKAVRIYNAHRLGLPKQ